MHKLAILALSALPLASCSLTDPNLEIFDQNFARWNSTAPASYDYRMQFTCAGCTPRVALIQVRDRVVVSRVFEESGEDVPAEDGPTNYPDIPQLFVLVRQAMTQRVAELQVGWNDTYGYPEIVFINPSFSQTANTRLWVIEPELTPVP